MSSPKPKIDTTVAHSARIWNYWLGGKDNYPIGRRRLSRAIARNKVFAPVTANQRPHDGPVKFVKGVPEIHGRYMIPVSVS